MYPRLFCYTLTFFYTMKSITVTNYSKIFHPAYCPPVEKIILTDSEVEVHFSDKSISVVNRSQTDHSYHVLEAIVQRIYGDVSSLDGKVSAPGFTHDLECLYSIAEYRKNNKTITVKTAPKFSKTLTVISKTSVPVRKTSRIANLLNATNEFLNAVKYPKDKMTEYIRPNKPFKDFTPSEKRAYWRAANKRRKSKNS